MGKLTKVGIIGAASGCILGLVAAVKKIRKLEDELEETKFELEVVHTTRDITIGVLGNSADVYDYLNYNEWKMIQDYRSEEYDKNFDSTAVS